MLHELNFTILVTYSYFSECGFEVHIEKYPEISAILTHCIFNNISN